MKKILTIIGARPQFIKSSVVSRAISVSDSLTEVIVHTGQHFDENMSDVFFSQMKLKDPKYRLNINSVSHGAMTGRMMEEIENIIIKERPWCVMVYGDTNSTLAGAIAARKLNVKLVHIEAGLRSYNNNMPEEINRILTDRISDILFCPSTESVKNLKSEGIVSHVYNVGDVMFDAVRQFEQVAMTPNEVDKVNKFLLATIHRAENTDSFDNLECIISSLNFINREIMSVVMPLHPRTERKIKEYALAPEFQIIKPVGYLEMLGLIKNSNIVVTDSGGLQKEAYFLGKNCLILRGETEWTELVSKGYNKLAKIEVKDIIEKLSSHYQTVKDKTIYGNANAAKEIVKVLERLE